MIDALEALLEAFWLFCDVGSMAQTDEKLAGERGGNNAGSPG